MPSILASPWWVAQLATGAKSFRDNPILGSPRLNAMGLHTRRAALAHRLAWARRARLTRGLAPEDRSAFDRDGFVVIRDFLPPAMFTALRDAVLAERFKAREMRQGNTITRRIAIGPGFLRTVPAAKALLQHPRFRALCRYVGSFESEPLHYIQAILTDSAVPDPDPQTRLHADTFHPTLKAWFFLNDVEEEDGPFSYVPGSHRLSQERLAWERARSMTAQASSDFLSARGSLRIDESELAALGLPPAQRFPVPANTLVVADTCGFHARVAASRPSRRLELWSFSRRNPFVPWTGGDLLSIPGIAERRIGAMWQIRDYLQKWMGQPWQPRGNKFVLDD
ncbi:phytanoyl-CoA dioxygenase family protein [Sphingomonas sp. R1]|uniref:phytanoyl-CoA dioxygenase family protein n=1 Tax=Sphingomonas sp. R1 TaxID=399176 RepID=UPI00222446C4|nr:phytanoyl-CoA dioxygenase family protein [Sphingomonas sp. R1]UYY76458.1 phytanoyl-CoA dioxygenase family protein [Sphingomonas sp. R1]